MRAEQFLLETAEQKVERNLNLKNAWNSSKTSNNRKLESSQSMFILASPKPLVCVCKLFP